MNETKQPVRQLSDEEVGPLFVALERLTCYAQARDHGRSKEPPSQPGDMLMAAAIDQAWKAMEGHLLELARRAPAAPLSPRADARCPTCGLDADDNTCPDPCHRVRPRAEPGETKGIETPNLDGVLGFAEGAVKWIPFDQPERDRSYRNIEKARAELSRLKSLRTAAARPAADRDAIRTALHEAAFPLGSAVTEEIREWWIARRTAIVDAALRTASAAQTPVSRFSDSQIGDWIMNGVPGEVYDPTDLMPWSERVGKRARHLLASPPQAAAQTGERERALEEAAKVCDMLAAELEADALTCKANPLNIIYPAHEVLKLQQGQASEAASRIRSLASPASGKETP